MNRTDIISQFKGAIRKESLKVTPQRLAIIENILDHPGHRECEEIYRDLTDQDVKVSRATIYRTLDLLVKYGFIRKMEIGDGRSRYEMRSDHSHHDHIICLECGTIVEFVDEEIERLQTQICLDAGFTLVSHSHQLFGVCRSCREKN